jgi:hypothetical protein
VSRRARRRRRRIGGAKRGATGTVQSWRPGAEAVNGVVPESMDATVAEAREEGRGLRHALSVKSVDIEVEPQLQRLAGVRRTLKRPRRGYSGIVDTQVTLAKADSLGVGVVIILDRQWLAVDRDHGRVAHLAGAKVPSVEA